MNANGEREHHQIRSSQCPAETGLRQSAAVLTEPSPGLSFQRLTFQLLLSIVDTFYWIFSLFTFQMLSSFLASPPKTPSPYPPSSHLLFFPAMKWSHLSSTTLSHHCTTLYTSMFIQGEVQGWGWGLLGCSVGNTSP